MTFIDKSILGKPAFIRRRQQRIQELQSQATDYSVPAPVRLQAMAKIDFYHRNVARRHESHA